MHSNCAVSVLALKVAEIKPPPPHDCFALNSGLSDCELEKVGFRPEATSHSFFAARNLVVLQFQLGKVED